MDIQKVTFKTARIIKGMKQSEVADALGVSVVTVSSWENGKTLPDAVQFRKLSALFDVSMEQFFCRKT